MIYCFLNILLEQVKLGTVHTNPNLIVENTNPNYRCDMYSAVFYKGIVYIVYI